MSEGHSGMQDEDRTHSERIMQAPAKVNLFLDVRDRRADGYHDIVSVFQEVDLCDQLRAAPADGEGVECICTSQEVPQGEDNLVVRAVRRLQAEAGRRDGICFHLEKRIPSGAGLGGGSSDAAAALRLANDLWGLGLERADLVRIGAEIGADVPFFMYGGTCMCEGRGERVTPLPEAVGLRLVLVIPPWRTDTATAYAALRGRRDPQPVAPFIDALRRGDRNAIACESYNRFEEVAGALEPRHDVLREGLEHCGALCARLSGSGSALWCLLPDRKSVV